MRDLFKRKKRSKGGQGTVEFLLLVLPAMGAGLALYALSTPLFESVFYGSSAQYRTVDGKPLAGNAGLERTVARPFP